MTDKWEKILSDVIRLCDFEEYMRRASETGIEEGEHEWFADDYVTTLPLLLLTLGPYQKVLTLPETDLSSMTNDLEKMWETIFDKVERQQGDYDDLDESEEEFEEEEKLEDDDAFEDDDTLEEDEILTPEEAFSNELHALQDKTNGILACLQSYTANDIPADVSPDELLQQAISISWSNSKKAKRLFGQASAAILRGAAYWPLWSLEVKDTILEEWWPGFISLKSWIEITGIYPLGDITQERIRFANKPERDDFNETDEGDSVEEELSPEAQRLMDVLLSGDEKLSDEQIASLPSFTPEIIKQMDEVITNRAYFDEETPGEGWAPIHAAQLLGKSGSAEAVEPLLKALYVSDPMDYLYSECIHALQTLGSLAFSAAVDSLRYSSNEDFRLGLAEVMGKIGRGNEHAFPILERYYQETKWMDDRGMAASAMAELGDRRALPLLYQALEDRDITAMGINEVVGAIVEIDPNYDPDKLKRLEAKARQRYDRLFVRYDKSGKPRCPDCGSLLKKNPLGEWEHFNEDTVFQTPPPQYKNVGRNEPCPCGSGKKYKHCHGSGKMTVN